MSIYQGVVSKYAQDLMMQDGANSLDPTQIQQGQPVYSEDGKEYLVVSDTDGTGQKVLMPSDQSGATIPQGVTTVDDSTLSTQYSLTNPSDETKMQARCADVLMNLPNNYGKSLSQGKGSKGETLNLRLGQDGYVEIMNSIQDMLEAGYGPVDVLLNIGEMYPREVGERVLEDARNRGIL